MISRAVGAVCVSFALLAGACGATQTRADASSEVVRGSGAILTVEGLGCPMCAESITALLSDVEGVASSKVNLENGTVDVAFKPGAAVPEASLARAVTDGGFTFRGLRAKE